jgi:hypothetical protein
MSSLPDYHEVGLRWMVSLPHLTQSSLAAISCFDAQGKRRECTEASDSRTAVIFDAAYVSSGSNPAFEVMSAARPLFHESVRTGLGIARGGRSAFRASISLND